MTRDQILFNARQIFVEFNNTFIEANGEDEAGLMRATDEEYFYPPEVIADVLGPGSFDRTIVVSQALNDELHAIGFIIVCHHDYSTIRHLVVEVDTDYRELEVPNA